MNKTQGLFALAAGLLIGAVILERGDGPPPVASGPKCEALGVAGSADFGDLVRLRARTSRGCVGIEATAVFMRLDLDAVAAQAPAPARPVALALVIDRSGSMEGEKIEQTRRAAKHLVDRLQDADQLAIVSYASDDSIDLPLTPLDAVGRAAIHRIIDGLEVGGGTHLSAGLESGLAELSRPVAGESVRRLVVLSDGNANLGETSRESMEQFAARARGRGTTLATLGVGVDFNEDVMATLAESGGGRYHYIRDARDMTVTLSEELESLNGLVARAVEVELALEDAVRLIEVYGYPTEKRGDRIVIPVGDMKTGEHRQIVAKLEVTARAPGEFRAARLTMRVASPGQNVRALTNDLNLVATLDAAEAERGHRNDVRETVEAVEAARVRQEAASHFSTGRRAEAEAKLRGQLRRIRTMAEELKSQTLIQQGNEIERTLEDITTVEADSDSGKDLVKREKQRARILSAY